MPGYLQNAKLAEEVLNKVRQKAICTNDIIPRDKMPFLYQDELTRYQAKFGKERIAKYLKYTEICNSLRDTVYQQVLEKKSFISPRTTACLALNQLGVGECQEFTMACAIEILRKNQTNFSVVILKGKQETAKIHYHHALLLVGKKLSRDYLTLSQFATLSDDVVVLDALRNHIGRANQYTKEQASYLAPFEYQEIFEISIFAKEHIISLDILDKQAKIILSTLKKQGIEPIRRQDFINEEKKSVRFKLNPSDSLPLKTSPVRIQKDSLRYLFHLDHHQKHATRCAQYYQQFLPKRESVSSCLFFSRNMEKTFADIRVQDLDIEQAPKFEPKIYDQ